MTNNKKIIVLGLLILVLAVFLLLLFDANDQLREIEKDTSIEYNSKPKKETVEVPGEPLITLNASLNNELSKYSYGSKILDNSVLLSKNIIDSQLLEGTVITEVTISDIEQVASVIENDFVSYLMYNVVLVSTDQNGKKNSYNNNYLIFVLRWDENNDGCSFVSILTEEDIKKFSEFDDPYATACRNEWMAYLSKSDQINDDMINDTAFNKAIIYCNTYHSDTSPVIESAEFIYDDNILTVSFDTGVQGLKISVNFIEVDNAYRYYYTCENNYDIANTEQ